jgi:hypothetical protein
MRRLYKIDVDQCVGRRGLDPFDSGSGLVTCCFVHGNCPSVIIKGGEFPDELRDC